MAVSTERTTGADGTEIVYHERTAGIYPATFTSIEPVQFTDDATGEVNLKWRWTFVDDNDEEIRANTTRTFKPRSNGLKFATGILGRAPQEGDRISEAYGTMVNVVYGLNQAGNLAVTDVLPFKSK